MTTLTEYQKRLTAQAALITDPYAYIQQKAPIALVVLSDIIEGELPAPIELRAKVASNWLDRAIGRPTTKVVIARTSQHITADDIAILKERAASAMLESTPASDPKYNSKLFTASGHDIGINDSGDFALMDAKHKEITLEEAEELYAFEQRLTTQESTPLTDYDRWLLARGIDKDTEARNHAYFTILYENERQAA